MATPHRYVCCVGFTVAVLLMAGCASRPRVACVGDAESLGYHDASRGQHSCADAVSGAETLAYQTGWNEGIQRFCTEDNGYQQGCQGAAFSNVCPDPLASSYLDGYQAGYSTYLSQLEVDALERSIELKTNELEQIWSMLDAVAHNLEQSDFDPEQRAHWLDQSAALTARQNQLGAQLDELEADVSARKAQLTQQRGAIAINY